VDEQAPEESLFALVDACAAAGVRVFIVHARKAWLQGLSPKENREVPPLDYALVRRLKRERPELTVVLNGGLASLDDAAAELAHVDGVMLGRAAYQRPDLLAEVDRRLFGASANVDPAAAVRAYLQHVERERARGTPLGVLVHPLIGLFAGRPGARAWRRRLTVEAIRPAAGPEVIESALAEIAAPPPSRKCVIPAGAPDGAESRDPELPCAAFAAAEAPPLAPGSRISRASHAFPG